MSEPAGQIASGLSALMLQLDTVSHNIANANTAGYKRRVTSFQKELQQQMGVSPDQQASSKGEIRTEQTLDFSQGTLVRTGRPLDVGLDGTGYLTLETLQGPLYTRNGSFRINSLRQLVDSAGRLVAGQNGPIVIPPTAGENQIYIGEDGTISANGAELGKLKMVDFGENESQLQPAGLGAMRAPNGVVPGASKNLRAKQGYQESSNVKVVQELVNLMSLSRLYENNLSLMRRRRENSRAMLGVANG